MSIVKSGISFIIYGESGVGKTPFVAELATHPESSPCLFIDVDGGLLETRGDTDVVRVNDWSTFVRTVKSLQKYKSVVIDSGTELEYVLRGTFTDNVPELQDYYKVQERMKRMYRFLTRSGLLVVVTAGVRAVNDELSGATKLYPMFQPTLVKDLIRMTDVVAYVQRTKEGTRKMHVKSGLHIIARDRSGVLEELDISGPKLSWRPIFDALTARGIRPSDNISREGGEK